MSIADPTLATDSRKIILVELDIGQQQVIWFNWSAFTYYVDFDAVYDLIDPAFLVGVSAQDIDTVGSVASDAAQLLKAASVAQVEGQENTFYWEAASRRVYIHLVAGDEPSLHRLVIGAVYGVANHAGVYGGTLYEGRLKSAPSLARRRDPLFWGRIEFGGGAYQFDNADGAYDRLAEDWDVFGNAIRSFLGFDDEPRSAFRQLCTHTVGTVRIGQAIMEVEAADSRRYLVTRIPDKQFTVAVYLNLKPGNEGKAISVAYGVLRNVPIMCTNEAESPAPATFNFKVCDCIYHGIKAIDAVRVDGVTVTPTSTDLVNGTFTLATADYDPGQKVTADVQGYKDAGGNLIANALDVIADILACWGGIAYSSASYDQAAWAAARAAAPDVCWWSDEPTEISEIIEDICATVRGLFLIDRLGRFTFRIPNPAAYPVQQIESWELLEEPAISYEPAETVGVVRVGYSPDWAEDERKYLRDDSRREAVLVRYKVAPERTFDTLLTTAAAAQAFATAVLDQAEWINRPLPLRLKLQDKQRELGDVVQVALKRRGGGEFIGTAKAEVIGVEYDLLAAEQILDCRVVEFVAPSVYVEGEFYGDRFYGDSYYGTSGDQEVA